MLYVVSLVTIIQTFSLNNMSFLAYVNNVLQLSHNSHLIHLKKGKQANSKVMLDLLVTW